MGREETLNMMESQKNDILTNIKDNNFANSKKLRNFASQNETCCFLHAPLTLEELENQLSFEEFFLEDDRRALREREERIKNLKNKIKDLKKKNGKAEEE